nr:phage tail tape measure protein [Bacillus licheniformis]
MGLCLVFSRLLLAGQTDLGVTADIVSDILTEFHIKAEDTNRVADAMAYTFTNSNATLQEIGQTMKYAAPAKQKRQDSAWKN